MGVQLTTYIQDTDNYISSITSKDAVKLYRLISVLYSGIVGIYSLILLYSCYAVKL